jgi:N4-gp56 family major capsid protein
VSAQGLAATSTLSTTNVRLAQRDLVGNRAQSFGDGFYGALISPWTGADFKGDTTWVNASQYSAVTQLFRGEIGRWFGCRFVETTLPGREDTSGAENQSAGLVYHNLFFGRNAFGHTELQNANQRLIYVQTGPDKTDPLDLYTIVGWKQIFANRQINAPHVVSVLTGATA